MSSALPPDTPMDSSWAEPADTHSQASKYAPMHREPVSQGQIGVNPSPGTPGKCVDAAPFEDQTTTSPVETTDQMYPQNFAPTMILDEIRSGGYTPSTRPVGEGTPAPTEVPGTRGLSPEAR